MADFEKVGLLTFEGDRFLMCRKNRFTSKLILPGGCVEPGESPLACLEREIREELGEGVRATRLERIGVYEDIAHCDDPSVRKSLRIVLFQGILTGDPKPLSEIVELVWIGPDSDIDELTPIFRNKILPDLRERGLLPW